MPETTPAKIERKRRITHEQAEQLLRSREDLLDDGLTDRSLREQVAGGSLHRVRRGHYVPTRTWTSLWPEGRHLLHIIAVCRDASEPPVLSHVSAAVVRGLPLYRLEPKRVHVCVPLPRHAGSASDVLRHELDLDDDDVEEIAGIRVTSAARTVLDVARTLQAEAALSIADAALGSAAVTRHQQDPELAASWRGDLEQRLDAVRGRPGTRRAERIVAFADGRAQLPGESVSRLRLHRLGFRNVDLQVRIPAPDGRSFYCDFGLDDINSFGEFDGLGKYLDPSMRGDQNVEEAVVEEKWREDWVRGTTRRGMLRWGGEHIGTVRAFASRLAAFGVPFTGDLRLDRRRLR